MCLVIWPLHLLCLCHQGIILPPESSSEGHATLSLHGKLSVAPTAAKIAKTSSQAYVRTGPCNLPGCPPLTGMLFSQIVRLLVLFSLTSKHTASGVPSLTTHARLYAIHSSHSPSHPPFWLDTFTAWTTICIIIWHAYWFFSIICVYSLEDLLQGSWYLCLSLAELAHSWYMRNICWITKLTNENILKEIWKCRTV